MRLDEQWVLGRGICLIEVLDDGKRVGDRALRVGVVDDRNGVYDVLGFGAGGLPADGGFSADSFAEIFDVDKVDEDGCEWDFLEVQ